MSVAQSLYSVLGFWRVMLNGALDQVRAKMIPIVVKQVKELEIADVVSDNYSVTNFKIPEFEVGHSEIRVEEGSIVKIILSGIDLRVTFSWGYKADITVMTISDNGTADIKTKSASAAVTARIGFDLATYTPTVTIVDSDFDVGELDIQLEGAGSTIVNFLLSYFRTVIANTINEQVRARLSTTIEDVLRDVLVSKQKMFRNIFFVVVTLLTLLFFHIIYRLLFSSSSPPPLQDTPPSPETLQTAEVQEQPLDAGQP